MSDVVVGGPGDPRVDAAELEAFIRDLFHAAGTSEADARLIAGIVVGTDLRGAYSHGCALVPSYVDALLAGRIDPKGRPAVVRDSGAALVADGGNTLGHVGLTFATEVALERAATTGVAAVALRGSNHCGAMAPYVLQGEGRDAIIIATSNGIPSMAWWGGLDPLLSLNPIGVLIPAGEEPSIVIDIAFAPAARGKIVVHQQQGLLLPEGWATDRDGYPTVDPATALGGLILPVGGHKGACMALVMGVLASLLSGGAYGTELGSHATGPRPGEDAQFVMALSIGAFEDPAVFRRRADRVIREIRTSRPAPGFDRVRVPGDAARETESAYRRDGVPLTRATVAALVAVAERAGAVPTLLAGRA
jgi:LDH2 family malate/lactate/ureidoglycolate dehydrogenase